MHVPVNTNRVLVIRVVIRTISSQAVIVLIKNFVAWVDIIYQTVLTRDGHCVMCSCYTCILLNGKVKK